MKTLSLTKKYDKYPEYKDSGIDWIGNIPIDWIPRKIARSFSLMGSGSTPSSTDESYYDEGSVSWVITGDLNDGILNESSKKITTQAFASSSALKMYPAGSLVVAMYGATIGKLAILSFSTCTNQACCVLAKSVYFNNKFLFYWFLGNKQNIIDNFSYGGGQPNISQNVIRSLKISTPLIDEQQKIAEYLDAKTAIIDKSIEQKEKLIELLKEKRTAVINKAVTRGLDENVELVDGRVEWIGKVPKGWKVEKLKFVAPLRNNKINIKNVSHETYIGLENIESGTGKIINVDENLEVESLVNTFNQGDVLFGKLRPYLEKVLQPNFSGVCTSELLVLIPQINKVAADFIFYRLFSSDFIKIVNNSTYGTKMPRASWDFIGNLLIAYPETVVQKTITLYLDAEINKIDQLTKKIKKSTELLQEYKSSLIFNVVTGKVKV